MDIDSKEKPTTFMNRERMMRRGYEAFVWRFVRIRMVTRLITLEIEISVGWKLERSLGEERKRRWK